MPQPPKRCPGPVSRRSALTAGALGFGGLCLPDLFRMRAAKAAATPTGAATAAAPDTSVIFVWLPGGPPHLDTYDLKPNAPAEIRGPYKPIATRAPGLEVCELLPMHAAVADRFTLVRSVAHKFADHGGGHKRFLTGRDPKEPTGFVNDYPAVGSIVAKMREHVRNGLPNYVAGMNPGRAAVDTYSFGSAYLGGAYVPFNAAGDPSLPTWKVENIDLPTAATGRLDDRLALLASLDGLRRDVDSSGTMDAMDDFRRQAVDLLTAPAAREAFDLSKEPDAVRDRYGRHAWGQRALLARRLVEAGVSFVTMVMENPYQSGVPQLKQGVYNWDSHAVNCHIFDDMQVRAPIYDRAVSALVEDLYARGLDKRTLLVVTGEFGRTPRIENNKGTQTGVMQPGRDHWPGAMSMLLAGGGMRTGQVVGSTNSKGEHPHTRPLTPNDLWATVYRHLGIDPDHAFPDHGGRPMPILPFGEPIRELLPA